MPEQEPPGRHGVEIPDDVAARLGGETKRAFRAVNRCATCGRFGCNRPGHVLDTVVDFPPEPDDPRADDA